MALDPQEMETPKIKVAIVLLNWNGKSLLEKFLPQIIENNEGAAIYIADNKSTDGSIEWVENNFSSVEIIQNNQNYGFAQGYNLALKEINAEYYVLINSDVEVTKSWLTSIISLMDKDKEIAACQPKILDYNKKNMFEYAGACGGLIDNLGYPFCRGRIFNNIEQDNGQYDENMEIFWGTGACLFLRASSFWEVDGFDNDFFAHQEEIDLCWRLKNYGYKIMAIPTSVVFHVGAATLEKNSPFKTYLNFRNNLFMIFKNTKLVSLIKILIFRLILDGFAALTFLNRRSGHQHFFSVIKAHFIFYLNIPKLISKRLKINQKPSLKGWMDYSILISNKVKGKSCYSEL